MAQIASHGGLNWEADTDCAGPYHLTSRFMYFVGFGTRSLAVERAGSVTQREAFETSRAAFYAIRNCTEPTNCGADLNRYSKLAAKAARAEYKRWAHCLSSAKYVNGFQAAVERRFADSIEPAT